MADLASLIPVTMIYDASLGSPLESQSLANTVLMIPPKSFPLPDRGVVYGQPGFSRQVGGLWQWVMGGVTDPVDQFVDSLTGKGSWVLPQSRTVMKTLVQRLYSAGIPKATIAQQVPQMYQAVAAEVLAEQTAATP